MDICLQLVIADVLKRKTEDGNDTVETKKPKLDIPIEEQMLMSTIPYHSVSYEEQVNIFSHASWILKINGQVC